MDTLLHELHVLKPVFRFRLHTYGLHTRTFVHKLLNRYTSKFEIFAVRIECCVCVTVDCDFAADMDAFESCSITALTRP